MAATNTMDAIKKKMQSMKLEKESALDKADQFEQNLKDQQDKNAKQEEEINDLQKRINQLEGELDQSQTQLEEATQKLEETEKKHNNIRKQKSDEKQIDREGDASSTKKRKKILVSRKDCPIHAKYRRGASIESIPEGNECRCRIKTTKTSKRPTMKNSLSGTPSSLSQSVTSTERRPEPEGSCLPTNIDSSSYILNDYSLFSDCEDVGEDLDVREELEKLHSKYKGLFSVAYLLKSTSSLKFTIIGSELKNISYCLKRAEAEVGALTRRIKLLEEDFEQTASRLDSATETLDKASKTAEDTERERKLLESRSLADDERIDTLETQLKEAKFIAEDADRKYDEAARKLAITEVDLERAEARLEAAEGKIIELEEELKVVGNNMKSLEISEQEASQREESYEESIRDLTSRLKEAEHRATEAERAVSKLQKEIDRLEDELLAEKEKYKAISENLDQTFTELAGF
ncbi:DgyrCDS2459 [Dimorphilus gyrociliatus]|uniref:DgyrCDS2459 n=1 Tax=Dimorphilus gyrociliatus TaxID=2664684 RepID=A0A7I8VAD5_9ANNE|nr:DgyrCDS2459 [Dimorphilus gyrociliatus]